MAGLFMATVVAQEITSALSPTIAPQKIKDYG
jgi:hypothetical protein